ncbi:Dabb family protein [Trabulsiella odontotermitis]|uniref:Dabb family protein n=1 Tax=Trabulsiella odontotermitis TaxID=379893 RepID=UPI0006763888|nr:stress protein [Trabulsiella odontotermitis]
MLRHLLLFSFLSDVTIKQVNDIRERFLHIPALIPGITSVEWGENNSLEMKNQVYTHCVNMTFDSDLSRARYLFHPDHEALQDVFVPLLNDIIIFDYEL